MASESIVKSKYFIATESTSKSIWNIDSKMNFKDMT